MGADEDNLPGPATSQAGDFEIFAGDFLHLKSLGAHLIALAPPLRFDVDSGSGKRLGAEDVAFADCARKFLDMSAKPLRRDLQGEEVNWTRYDIPVGHG
ncbi:MAG: hypothetical protein ACREXY_05435 [Gammaproteobacteria bacterium]